MSVPNWAIALTIEFLILLMIIIVFLALGWRLSSKKKDQALEKLQNQLNRQKKQTSDLQKQIKSLKTDSNQTVEAPPVENKEQQEEIELLKIQLEQARDNPFLQEKIDALTAENEDLQTQLKAYRE